jgi:hypothetical protein
MSHQTGKRRAQDDARFGEAEERSTKRRRSARRDDDRRGQFGPVPPDWGASVGPRPRADCPGEDEEGGGHGRGRGDFASAWGPSPTSERKARAPKRVSTRDANVARCLPSVIRCNGEIVQNNFRSSVTVDDAKSVSAFFSNYSANEDGVLTSDLTKNLVAIIRRYGTGGTVLGCVAWLSNSEVLEALGTCRRVLIVVNKEDYSRWGGGSMLKKYEALPRFDEPLSKAFEHIEGPLKALENRRTEGDSRYLAVRSFGSPLDSGGGGGGAWRGAGRAGIEHCKYLIFFKGASHTKTTVDNVTGSVRRETVTKDVPAAVWMGSMNMTKASESHHETAQFIESEKLATAYLEDFSQTFMHSTPLGNFRSRSTPYGGLRRREG